MKIIYPINYKEHEPQFEIFNGEKEKHQEVSKRVDCILTAIKDSSELIGISKTIVPVRLLEKVHTKAYLKALKLMCQSIKPKKYNYPNVFPLRSHGAQDLKSPIAIRGLFSFDMYTPLYRTTYTVALESASCAYYAAKLLHQEKNPVYALCRPPGHHAEKDQMGGYCYINNTALAAEYLSTYGKVAILDVDVHHGNGTQGIFYERNDVLTISIHANPAYKFPYFSGTIKEKGRRSGIGYNINYPLPLGTNNTYYHKILLTALSKIKRYDPQFLVVAYGGDTHIDDPIGGFRLTTDYFAQMSKEINKLNLPTLIVQEGGYNTNVLGLSVKSFLKGFV